MTTDQITWKHRLTSIVNVVVVVAIIVVGWDYWDGNSEPGKRLPPGESVPEPVRSDDELRPLLWDPQANSVERHRAMQVWGQLGAKAVPILVDGLESRHPSARKYVMQSLCRIGPDAAPAVPVLRKLLHDEDAVVREGAVDALYFIGDFDEALIADLAPMLADNSEGVRTAVSQALVGLGAQSSTSLPVLRELLQYTDPSVRELTSNVLAAIGRPAVDHVLQMVEHESAYVRREAMRTLIRLPIPEDVTKAVSLVHPGLSAQDGQERLAAYRCFAHWRELSLVDCRRGLHDPLDEIVHTALNRLADMPDEAVPAIAELVALLEPLQSRIESSGIGFVVYVNTARVLRNEVFATLAAIGAHPEAQSAVPFLLHAINDDEIPELPELRARLALGNKIVALQYHWPEWLSAICSDHEFVAERLIVGLEGDEDLAISACARCLRQIAPQRVPGLVSRMEKQLLGANPVARWRARCAFEGFGPAAAESVPVLVAELKRHREETQSSVMHALAAIGPGAKSALPEMVAVLEQTPVDDHEWSWLVRVMRDFGPTAAPAVPELVRQLKRMYFKRATRDDRWNDRAVEDCVTTLGEIGPAAAEKSLPLLRVLAFDRTIMPRRPRLRYTVFKTLLKVVTGNDRLQRELAVELIEHLTASLQTEPPTADYGVSRQRAPSIETVFERYDRALWVRTLGQFEAFPELIVPVLIDALDDDTGGVQLEAIDALARFGSDAKPAVAILQELIARKGSTDRVSMLLPVRPEHENIAQLTEDPQTVGKVWGRSIRGAVRDAIAAIQVVCP